MIHTISEANEINNTMGHIDIKISELKYPWLSNHDNLFLFIQLLGFVH
jgi:hypothetical protein